MKPVGYTPPVIKEDGLNRPVIFEFKDGQQVEVDFCVGLAKAGENGIFILNWANATPKIEHVGAPALYWPKKGPKKYRVIVLPQIELTVLAKDPGLAESEAINIAREMVEAKGFTYIGCCQVEVHE